MLFKVFFAFYFLANCFVFSSNVTVKIENGQVNGRIIKFHNQTINIFTGIRYANAPIGSLRFKRPQKVSNWSVVYDATSIKNKYSCYQPIKSVLGIPIEQMNENCLFLNVWTPDVNPNKTKSVMFYIHGGAFEIGSSFHGEISLDPTALTLFDVVVVSINYRLGVFGFLYGGNDEEAPGNVGLYDQLLALNWVKTNIHAFGGDPNDITVFGQSAGSMSVAHLILSSLSKGMFKKAILESGAPIETYSFKSKNESFNQTLKLSKNLCSNNTDLLKCLKNVKPIDLLKNCDENVKPIVGEHFYPIDSVQAVKSGKFNSDIQIMSGTTENEGTGLSEVQNIPFNSSGINLIRLIRMFSNEILKMNIRLKSQNDRNQILDFYLPLENQTKSEQNKTYISDDNIRYQTGQLFGDYLLSCPTYFLAKNIALWSDKNKVHFYKFNFTAAVWNKNAPKWVGVTHGAETPFVFGYPLFNPQNFSAEEYQFSLLTITLWTNFAKTGNPMNDTLNFFKNINLPEMKLSNMTWPTFERESNNSINTYAIEMHPKRFGKIINEPFKHDCEAIWKSVLDY